MLSALFRLMLNNAEPFALDLQVQPWRVAVRAQVILAFVALGLGKGGLFLSTFLIAMAWLDTGWTAWTTSAVLCSTITVLLLAFGYLALLGRIEAVIEPKTGPKTGLVHLTRRIPFHRRTVTQPLSAYQGIAHTVRLDRDKWAIHTLVLRHENADLNVPLWRRRRPESPPKQPNSEPMPEQHAYAEALGLRILENI